MGPEPNIFVFGVGMKTSSNRIGHKARQDLKLLFRCFVSIALHRNEVVFKRIGIFFDALLEKKINEYNQFWPKILKKDISVFSIYFSHTNTAFINDEFLFGSDLLRLDIDDIDDKDTVVQSPRCENIMFLKQEKLRYFNNI